MANIGDMEVTLRLRDEVTKQAAKIERNVGGGADKLAQNFGKVSDKIKELNRELTDVKKALAKTTDPSQTQQLERQLGKIEGAYKRIKSVLSSQNYQALLDNRTVANTIRGIDSIIQASSRLRESFGLMFPTFGEKYGDRIRQSLLNAFVGVIPYTTRISNAFSSWIGYAGKLGSTLLRAFSGIRSINISGMFGNAANWGKNFGSSIYNSIKNSFSSINWGKFAPNVKSWIPNWSAGNVLQRTLNACVNGATQLYTSLSKITFSRNTTNRIEELNKALEDSISLSSFLNGKILQLASAEGIRRMAMSIIEVGGELEKQHIALRSIIGDIDKADKLFAQTKQLALQSPFTFGELNRDMKQLAAYGIEYNELYDTAKRLADISAGVGVSFERIALAYGQTRARAKLDGKELRQFANAGIPLLQKLADYYTQIEGKSVSAGEVRKRTTAGEVSFDDVKKVLFDMTDAGGIFYNQQLVLSETLLGRYNKLKDAWEIMLSDFASADSIVGSSLMHILNGLTAITQNIKSLIPLFTTLFGFASIRRIGAVQGLDYKGLAKSIVSTGEKYVSNNYTSGKIDKDTYDRQLVAVKNINKQLLTELATEKQLTRQQLESMRLYRMITKEELQTLAALNGINVSTSRWVIGLRLAGVAITNVAKSMWSMLGGLPGIALMGVTYLVSEWMASRSELTDQIRDTSERIKRTHDDISSFIESNPINISLSDSDLKEQIKAYKEKITEVLGHEPVVLHSVSNGEILQDLQAQATMIKAATAEAEKYVGVFENAANDSNKWNTEGLTENLEEWRKAWAEWQREGADQAEWGNVIEKFGDFEANANDMAKKIKDSLKGIKDPEMKRYVYDILQTAWIGGLELDPISEDALKLTLTKKVGLGFDDTLKEIVAKGAKDKISQPIKDAIENGRSLTEAMKLEATETLNEVLKVLQRQFPEFASDFQSLLSSQTFYIDIVQRMNGNKEGDLLKSLKERMDYNGLSDTQKRYIDTWFKEDSQYSANNAAKSVIDAKYNEYKARKKAKKSQASINESYNEWQEAVKAAKYAGYDYNGEEKKSNKEHHQKDAIAEAWRNRLNLMKEYVTEFRKWEQIEGRNNAVARMDKQGWVNALGKGFDFSNPEQAIRDYFAKNIENIAATKEQKAVEKDFMKVLFGFDETDAKKQIDEAVSQMQKQIRASQKKWSLYEKAKESTSDTGLASQLAFGGDASFKNSVEYFGNEIRDYLAKNNVDISFDELVNLSDKEIIDRFKDEIGKPLAELVKAYSDATEKLADETISNYLRILKESANYEQKIADIRTKLETDINTLHSQGNYDPAREDWLRKKAQEAEGSVLFDQFKETSGWVQLFDDLGRASTTSLKKMEESIKSFASVTNLGVQDTKALVEALRKLREENTKRNPFGAIASGFSSFNPYESILNNPSAKFGDKYRIGNAMSRLTGKEVGDYTEEQIKEWLEAYKADKVDNFVKGLQAAESALKAFEDVLKPVADMFDALGKHKLADIIGIGSSAFGTAASTANSFSTLQKMAEGAKMDKLAGALGNAGPYAAAAAAAISLITSVSKLHDKALQEEIDASERRRAQMERIYGQIENTITKSLYSVYGEGDKGMLAGLEKQIAAMRKITWYGQDTGSYVSEDTKKALAKAQSTGANYDIMLASLNAQRDEKAYQLSKEENMKSKDDGKIQDLKNQLEDAEKAIEDFAKEMLDTLYGIDIKGWAKTLTDTIVDAWANGKDAVKAYKDAVNDLMKGVVTNIIQQSVVEKALNESGVMDMLTKAITDQSGKLYEENVKRAGDIIKGTAEKTVAITTDLLERFKAEGYDFGANNSANGTLSSSIQNITESTADILASYLNSVRLFVASDNAMFTNFFNTTVPYMNEIQESQLTQLQMIATNTYRNAESAARMEVAVDNMNSIFTAVTNGTKRIYVN